MENTVLTTRDNESESYNQYQYNFAWNAILIGATVSLGYEVLLNFLGMGLGLSAFDFNGNKMFKIGSGALIWLTVSGIISMGIGGFFVGVFSDINCKLKNCCQAITAWSLATLVTVFITTTAAGVFIGGAASVVKNSIPEEITVYSQSNGSVQNIASSQFSDKNDAQNKQNEAEKNINKASDNMGKISIVLFLAFLLSGFASIIGALCGSKFNRKI